MHGCQKLAFCPTIDYRLDGTSAFAICNLMVEILLYSARLSQASSGSFFLTVTPSIFSDVVFDAMHRSMLLFEISRWLSHDEIRRNGGTILASF